MSETLDLISDLTAGLEAATSIFELHEDCDEEGVCEQTICQYAGCVVNKIKRARAIMAAAGWEHISGDLDAADDRLFWARGLADRPAVTNHPNRSKRAKWLPIESAPKDGSAVLLWGVAMTPVVGRYWLDGDMGGMRACWTYAISPAMPETSGPIPTHWMPLPDPPSS